MRYDFVATLFVILGVLAGPSLLMADDADAAVTALSMGLNETLTRDPDMLDAAHEAIKEVTDLLKIDIATVLSLEVPSEAAGDND